MPLPPGNVEVYIATDRRAEYAALRASSRSEDRRVFAMLEKAVGVLKENPYAGDRIRRRQIPAEYHRRFGRSTTSGSTTSRGAGGSSTRSPVMPA